MRQWKLYKLPLFMRTAHIDASSNCGDNDLILSSIERDELFGAQVTIEEKLDGASMGFMFDDNLNAHLCNKEKTLVKAFTKAAKNPSSAQFLPAWTWIYEHGRYCYSKVCKELDYNLGEIVIYGEWLFMQHGIIYSDLPSEFIAYDIYDLTNNTWLDSNLSRQILANSGFATPPILYSGVLESLEQIIEIASRKSNFSDVQMEGIIIRFDGAVRYKYVNPDFVRGQYFSDHIIKNNVRK